MKRPLIVIALLLLLLGVPLLLWTWESFRPEQAAKPRSVLQAVFSPFARFAAWSSDSLASGLERLVTAGMVREKNELLQEQVARLEAENAVLREELLKWERLRQSVDIADKGRWPYVAAEVIAFGERHWMGSLMVNKGRDDGIRVGDPAIYMQGLAGVVVRVTDSTATIHLLNDPETAVLATVLPIRKRGLVRGTGRSGVAMEISMEDPSVQLKPGYEVITSGLRDSLYPRGLKIGAISGLGKNRFGQVLGEIEPSVDFGNIEEVLILMTGRETSTIAGMPRPSPGEATTATLPNDPDPALLDPALPTTATTATLPAGAGD
ncbi:MAG: rod shape-determining protein MreC [Candidatus Sumerlaeota bacterium]